MPPPPAPPPSTPERLEQLVSAGLLLTSELSLEGVLQRVADLACQIIGSRYAAIGVLSDDHLKLDAFVTAGIDQETRTRIGAPPIGRGVLGTVMRDRRILRLADLQKHPDSSGFPPRHPPMHSFLGVPIERPPRRVRQPLPHREAGRRRRSPTTTSTSPCCWRRQAGGRGGERPAARGERPAAGGGPAAAAHARAVLRDGQPRAAQRARRRCSAGPRCWCGRRTRPPCRGRPSRCSIRPSRRSR